MADWRQGKTVTECQLRMFDDQLACDFQFLVTRDKKQIGAHKFMLYCRSSVFQIIVEGSTQSDIEDVSYDAFQLFLRYVYGADIEMNRANAEVLLPLANKYGIQELSHEISEFYESILKYQNCLKLFAIARQFDLGKLEIAAFDLIVKDSNRCLADEEFKYLPYDCLGLILNSDHFSSDEENIFEAAVRWSEERCHKAGIEVNPENQRKALGDLLYHIRFPIMNRKYFSDVVLETHLLDADEGLSVLRYITDQGKSEFSALKFPKRRRHGQFIGGVFNPPTRLCQRLSLSADEKRAWNYNGKLYDIIDFVSSKPIVLKGFQVFGPHKGGCADYKLRYSVSDSEYILCQASVCVSVDVADDPETCCEHFYFPTAVDLNDNKKYTIAICLDGPDSMYGESGSSQVTVDGVIFEFFKNENSLNGTDVKEGQIPGILFSKQRLKNMNDMDISMKRQT